MIGLSLIAFYFAYYSILQFLKISPIILPKMPIILLLFSLVIHIAIMKMVTYTKITMHVILWHCMI